MTYCQKCGTQNEDDAVYCKKCGAPLDMTRREHRREKDRCEDECSGGGRSWAIFWGVIIVLIGLFIILEVVVKNILNIQVVDSQVYGWVIAAVIGIFIIAFGLRILTKH